ncbi:MAG: c-type cytochrome [Granulosicoccus sp.]
MSIAEQKRSEPGDLEVLIHTTRSVCWALNKCGALFLLTAGLLLSPAIANSNDSEIKIAPGLGKELSVAELDSLPKHVFSEGEGLPEGSGTADQGAILYAEHCASCHGALGQGARAVELVGDRSLLATQYPDKGIGVYWPNAPTLFEYIYRSMPPDEPASFSADELYSLVAHLLFLNGIVDENSSLDAEILRSVQMPNRNGFRTIAE